MIKKIRTFSPSSLAFFSKNKNALFGVSSRGISALGGSLVAAMTPLILTVYLGGETEAGIAMAVLALMQAFIFTTLAGNLFQKYNLITVFMVGILAESFGAILWYTFQNTWSFVVFSALLLLRPSFFSLDPFLLKSVEKEKGGFWFGMRDQMLAMGNYVGLMCFPFFLLIQDWQYIPFIIVGLNCFVIALLLQIDRNLYTPSIEKKNESEKKSGFFTVFSKGIKFIKKNHSYPLFYIGSQIFEGLFYGAIWFLFPLYFAVQFLEGGEHALGIYEVITVFLSLACGIIADSFSWRKLEAFSWIFVMALSWTMYFFHDVYSLIIIGFLIGLSNNIFASAGYHALVEYNENKEDERAFTVLGQFIKYIGYAISPMIIGVVYEYFGFQGGLMTLALFVSAIGTWILLLLFREHSTRIKSNIA